MASTLLLALVFVFDLVAFSLAVAAEQRRTSFTIAQEGNQNYCQYDSDMATGLGVGSFIILVATASCLLAGSVRNAYHTKYRTVLTEHPPSCQTLRKGVFGAGAAFIVFTGIASELYYVHYSKANSAPSPYARDTGVTMANL
ncbi:fiber protein Fb34 [Senna tora]|uniref:Fiber protein Fb34 n=1 Tax=Senna tora TaxID=362788 RepID=A0A834W003_9FABA|nr:fiber protein Fb34 [Senna tora]